MNTLITLAAASLACSGALSGLGNTITQNETSGAEASGSVDGHERLSVGDTISDFTINTPVAPGDAESVTLRELLKDGPVVLTFFRGSWCPYCRTELSEFQDNISEFESLGATVLAVSPEISEKSDILGEDIGASFYIAHDENNKLAKQLDLAFKLDAKTIQRYKQYGINLREANGARVWELPVPATYVIDQEGVIRFVFDDEDYSKRASVKDILSVVEEAS